MGEHHGPVSRENHVGPAGHVGYVKSVAESAPMEPASEDHLGFRVFGPDPAHHKPALFGIQYVGGLASDHSDIGAIRLQRSSPGPVCQLQRRQV